MRRERGNLHVALRAHVMKVLVDQTTKRAYGVKFWRGGAVHAVTARKEVNNCKNIYRHIVHLLSLVSTELLCR